MIANTMRLNVILEPIFGARRKPNAQKYCFGDWMGLSTLPSNVQLTLTSQHATWLNKAVEECIQLSRSAAASSPRVQSDMAHGGIQAVKGEWQHKKKGAFCTET
jgi:hypothetical protein